jgi:hypothetical protein
VAIALLAGSACLGAVAYAATGTGGREAGVAGRHVAVGAPHPSGSPAGRGQGERVPRVRLIETPAESSTATDTQFRFNVPPREKATGGGPPWPAGPGVPAPRRRLECSLDGGRWIGCSSPHRLVGLAPGAHAFAVRALTRDGREGPGAAYDWQRVEPVSVASEVPAEGKPFSIEQTAAIVPLYPGDPAQQVPLAIGNPNSAPIEVVGLTVTIGSAPPGCGAENFELTASSASEATPLTVPAESTVELPAAAVSAPAIALRDLPVNQDACQGAQLELALSGEARG